MVFESGCVQVENLRENFSRKGNFVRGDQSSAKLLQPSMLALALALFKFRVDLTSNATLLQYLFTGFLQLWEILVLLSCQLLLPPHTRSGRKRRRMKILHLQAPSLRAQIRKQAPKVRHFHWWHSSGRQERTLRYGLSCHWF